MSIYLFLNQTYIFFKKIADWCAAHLFYSLFAIFLLGLFLKVLVWLGTAGVSRDGALYLQMIQTLHDTGSYSEVLRQYPHQGWIPPMYIYLASSVMRLGADAEFSGVLVNILLGSLLPFVGYFIVYNVTENKKISLVSALFLAVNPAVTTLSVEVQREISFLFFVGCSLGLFFYGVRKQRWYCFCGTGVFLALAMLTRYETGEFILLLPAGIIFLAAMRKLTLKTALSGVAGIVFSFVIVFVAFIYFTGNISLLDRYKNYFSVKYKTVEEKITESGGK